LRAAKAILSVYPLDSFIYFPLERMEVEDDPNKTTALQDDVLELARKAEERDLEYGVIPRLNFYERAKQAYAVVHTLETQPYGCFILHKGVIFEG
jgi:Fucose dissimilation pathway protein FucU